MIKNTKNKLDRKIVVHETMIKGIKQYLKYRVNSPLENQDFIFTTRNGLKIAYSNLHRIFHGAIDIGGFDIDMSTACIHDFRFSFAVNTIQQWYDNNLNINIEIFKLKTYMGHKHLRDTIYYLEFVNPIIKLAFEKFNLKNLEERCHEK